MKNDAGVSTVISVMLILAILAICMASFSATYLPGLKQNAEILHSDDVEEAFMRFSGDVDSVYALDRSAVFSETFKLGGGDILLSPSTSSGTVEIQNVSLGTLTIDNHDYIELKTVNVSYMPYLTVWKQQGYLYGNGLVWVTLGSMETPASLADFMSVNNDSFTAAYIDKWIGAMKDSLEIENNTATVTLTDLYADPDPSANYVTGSGSVKLSIDAKRQESSETYELLKDDSISFEFANGTTSSWYKAPDNMTVTLNIISAKVSVG